MNPTKEILKLSIDERILAVTKIWDSIAEENADIPLSAAQKKELERRLEKLERGESKTYSWEEVKKRIRKKIS